MSVILFHWGGLLGIPFRSPVGVSVFFVLSGFIITRLLWRRRDTQTYREFLRRRVRRLYPALIGVVVVATFLVILAGLPWRRAGIAAVLALTQLNTFAIPAGAPYFAPFGVTWSLSAEWVGYLLLPLLILAVRRWPVRRVAVLLAVLAVALYLVSLLMPLTWFYFGPLARIAQLLAGGALALATHRLEPGRGGAALVGVGSIVLVALVTVWAFVGEGAITPEYALIGFPLTTAVGLVLVLGSAYAPTWPMGRLLSARPVAALGRASYSLYLWHVIGFDVFAPIRGAVPDPVFALICAAFVGVATWLSYRYLEKPFMHSRATALESHAAP